MRNMSFLHTEAMIVAGTKTVTRRTGWAGLKAGELVRPVRKTRGLRRGESVVPLRAPLRIVNVRREPLSRLRDPEYGPAEIAKEGFRDDPELGSPAAFIDYFCRTHPPCTPASEVTRIEFELT